MWQFPGDELKYYESWCNVFDGDWLNESYECGFKDHQDYDAAKKDLRQILSPTIEGEQAEIFCEIMHKECEGSVIFRGEYDPRTDITHYKGTVEGFGGITLRIIDNKIRYANAGYEDNWIEWNDHVQEK